MSHTALVNGALLGLVALLALLLVIFVVFAIFLASTQRAARGAWHAIRRVLGWTVRAARGAWHAIRRVPGSTIRTVRRAWPYIRRTLAALIVICWVGINAYWFDVGGRPWCQVTTVTQPGSPGKTTTSRDCGLPDATSYLGVLALAALLLYPDAKTIWIGGFGIERRLGPAEDVTAEATGGDVVGDVIAGSKPAQELIQERFGAGS
jgi:hypothetical protein